MKYSRWFIINQWLIFRFEYKPQDLWVGVYYHRTQSTLRIWICLLPMLPIHIESSQRGDNTMEDVTKVIAWLFAVTIVCIILFLFMFYIVLPAFHRLIGV